MLNEYGKDCCEGYGFDYVELVRKSDNKQVYTSPAYLLEGSDASLDMRKIAKTLNYYFERVNSAIDQQLLSPRLSDDQKKNLKKLDKKDYVVSMTKCMPNGFPHKVYWSDEAEKFLK